MKTHRLRAGLPTVLLVLSALGAPATSQDALGIPQKIELRSRHLRIDLEWERTQGSEYEVQRADGPDQPFRTLTNPLPSYSVFSDFIGSAAGEYRYMVRSIHRDSQGQVTENSEWSNVITGTPRKGNVEDLLTEIQEASFRFFYEGGHPVSGLALERSERTPDCCAIGATGMGLFNLGVGIERGFVSRKDGAERVLKIVQFLSDKAQRFHGAFPHQLNGTTGAVIPFSRYDDGADLVETAFLAQGLLFTREYFNGSDQAETEIRERSDKIWREIEWDFFSRPDGLNWHWSPKYEWKKGLSIHGFNECMIVYLLAMASPTHAIDSKLYWSGWQECCGQVRTSFDIPLQLGRDLGGPLFFTHYSYLGFDPRKIQYAGRNYFDHFRDLCRVQIRYAESNKDKYVGYGPLWGITASLNPKGYKAHEPGPRDDGTLAPTAALSSMPYVPEESRACLLEMYEKHGAKLWGPFGFYDAFNLSKNWVSTGYLGIDVGPVAPMIENQRTGLCWNTFMKVPELTAALKTINRTAPEVADSTRTK